MSDNPKPLKRKDFSSDQMVRWCPGCGDYSILSQVQTVMAGLGVPREDFAVVAGIGCSSRFPYYMKTYGFHTIHGRAPAFASGLKCARPELSVWVATGDGDALSIGGNHLIHVLRRNVDLNILLFNNRIYGLTKGQYSPTSEQGKKTKSSPMGSLDAPFNPIAVALGSGGSYVARTIDSMTKHVQGQLKSSYAHKGTSFLEIYQNCVIFNDGAFDDFAGRDVRAERLLHLEHGQPLVWGKEQRMGFVLDGLALKAVPLEADAPTDHILVHDTTNLVLATLLAHLDPRDGSPVPIGTFYQVDRPTYDDQFQEQVAEARKVLGKADLGKLLSAGDTWTVGS